MYTVAIPDPNSRGGGQLPNPNECNSTLMSGTSGAQPPPAPYILGERVNYLTVTTAILH